MEKVSLQDKFSLFSEYWTPKIVGGRHNPSTIPDTAFGKKAHTLFPGTAIAIPAHSGKAFPECRPPRTFRSTPVRSVVYMFVLWTFYFY